MIDSLPVVSRLLGQAEHLQVIAGTHFWDLLDEGQREQVSGAKRTYLSGLSSLTDGGAVPYEHDPGAPSSVFHTVVALSNLVDMGQTDHGLTRDLVGWLLRRQDEGWWSNPELNQLPNIPPWFDHSNVAVKLFTTSMTTGVLSRLLPDTVPLEAAMSKLELFRQDNGSFLGFPQTTWLLTPAVARVHGVGSTRFMEHWVIIDQLRDNMSTSEQISLYRLLCLSGLDPSDSLFDPAIRLIEGSYSSEERGWLKQGSYDASTSLAALLVLQYLSHLS